MKKTNLTKLLLIIVLASVMLGACGNKKGEASASTPVTTVDPQESTKSNTFESTTKNTGEETKAKNSQKAQVNEEKTQPKREVTPQINSDTKSKGGVNSNESQEGKVRTNIITSDLEYDNLPDCWKKLESGAAEVSAYYGYFNDENSGDNPDAAIYIRMFDGEKRYYSQDGIRERLQEWNKSDTVTELVISRLNKGMFGYTYTCNTERDGKAYIGYVFEEKDTTWEIGYYSKKSLSEVTGEKLKSDYNNMIKSCRVVELEGDMA